MQVLSTIDSVSSHQMCLCLRYTVGYVWVVGDTHRSMVSVGNTDLIKHVPARSWSGCWQDKTQCVKWSCY